MIIDFNGWMYSSSFTIVFLLHQAITRDEEDKEGVFMKNQLIANIIAGINKSGACPRKCAFISA